MGLVITRKEGQGFMMTGTLKEGEEISVKIESMTDKRAKIYIEAPDSITILRDELVSDHGTT